MSGQRIEHEQLAAQASRQRRLENGEPPAQWVLDAWRQRRRLARGSFDLKRKG
jgi:hypothetical protein